MYPTRTHSDSVQTGRRKMAQGEREAHRGAHRQRHLERVARVVPAAAQVARRLHLGAVAQVAVAAPRDAVVRGQYARALRLEEAERLAK